MSLKSFHAVLLVLPRVVICFPIISSQKNSSQLLFKFVLQAKGIAEIALQYLIKLILGIDKSFFFFSGKLHLSTIKTKKKGTELYHIHTLSCHISVDSLH